MTDRSAGTPSAVRQLFDLSRFPFFMYKQERRGWSVYSDLRGFDEKTFPPGSIGEGTRAAGLTATIAGAFFLQKPVYGIARKGDFFIFWTERVTTADEAIIICIETLGPCDDTTLPYFEAWGRQVRGGIRKLRQQGVLLPEHLVQPLD